MKHEIEPIEGALFDSDKTILSTNSLGLPTNETRRVCIVAGETVFTAGLTARQPQKALYLSRPLGFTSIWEMSNGAQLYDTRTETMLVKRTLDPELTMQLCDAFEQAGIYSYVQVNGVDRSYTEIKREVTQREIICKTICYCST